MVQDFVQEAGDELSKEEIEAFKTAEGSEYLAEDVYGRSIGGYGARYANISSNWMAHSAIAPMRRSPSG